jgi:hypothetical protein
VSHTSMTMAPNTNAITVEDVEDVITQAWGPSWGLVSDGLTEYGEIPPIGDLLVNGHETSMDIGLLSEVAVSINPDPLAVVQKSMHEEGGD